MAKRPTLRDVSEAANVSVFTVSRAMNGGTGVSETTRAHVRQIAADLGYIPNQLARGLKGGATRTVGVLTANTNNLYYATLIGALERTLQTRGFHCLVMDAVLDGVYRTDREDVFVEELLQHQVRAVVLTYRISDANMEVLRRHDIEMVFVDTLPPAQGPDAPSVNSDNYVGSHRLGEHMVWHGYDGPWLFIGFTSSWTSRVPRERGFVDAAAAAGIAVDVVEGGNDTATAHGALISHLDAVAASGRPAPRVIFAGNELLLKGALVALHERGLRVPDDVALVSYDDFDWAPFVAPPMTVVDQHIPLLGENAARALLAGLGEARPRTDGGIPIGTRIEVPSTLVVRRSCGCTDTDPLEEER